MIAIKHILCPIDFSDCSRRALSYAMPLARRYNAQLAVLHVVSLPNIAAGIAAYGEGFVSDPMLFPAPDLHGVETEILRFADAEGSSGLRLKPLAVEGETVEQVLQATVASQADLIVMGTHGRSGFQRLLLGSVVEKVLRTTASPMLTVPPHVPDTLPAAPGLFGRILCPVDFSDASLRALEYAFLLAGEAGAELTLMHVMEIPAEYEELEIHIADHDRLRRDYHERALARMRDTVPASIRALCRVEANVPVGKPYREILRLATEQRSDLIVMGVAGRAAADMLLFGSTTNQVIRLAGCPVLTVRKST